MAAISARDAPPSASKTRVNALAVTLPRVGTRVTMPRQVPDRRLLARERIARIPRVTDRLKPHVARVEHHKTPHHAGAEAHGLANDLQRHHRAEHAGERAKNAGLRASRDRSRRRRDRKQAAIGRIGLAIASTLMRPDCRERAVEHAERCRDERLLRRSSTRPTPDSACQNCPTRQQRCRSARRDRAHSSQ